MRGGFPGKGSNLPSLYLRTDTRSFVPLKDEDTERAFSQDGRADSRITLVACLPPTSQRLRKWQRQPARRDERARVSQRAAELPPTNNLPG